MTINWEELSDLNLAEICHRIEESLELNSWQRQQTLATDYTLDATPLGNFNIDQYQYDTVAWTFRPREEQESFAPKKIKSKFSQDVEWVSNG